MYFKAMQFSLVSCRLLSSGITNSTTRISCWRSIGYFRSLLNTSGTSVDKKKGKTPMGKLDQTPSKSGSAAQDPFAPFPQGTNPSTGEVGGPTGPEPTRYGDWERKGRVTDF